MFDVHDMSCLSVLFLSGFFFFLNTVIYFVGTNSIIVYKKSIKNYIILNLIINPKKKQYVIRYYHYLKVINFSYMRQIVCRIILQTEQFTWNFKNTCLDWFCLLFYAKSVDLYRRVYHFEKMNKINHLCEK